jgi:hypothetical protein
VLCCVERSFLRKFEAPSGGDYSIHRGAALFVQGVEQVTISQNRFRNLGSNALFISLYAVNTTITQNQFRFLGESAIILAGQTDGIDGVSNVNQPTNTHVEANLARDFSAYVKQGDAIFESLARNSVWAGNLAFNSPRSIFNKVSRTLRAPSLTGARAPPSCAALTPLAPPRVSPWL